MNIDVNLKQPTTVEVHGIAAFENRGPWATVKLLQGDSACITLVVGPGSEHVVGQLMDALEKAAAHMSNPVVAISG